MPIAVKLPVRVSNGPPISPATVVPRYITALVRVEMVPRAVLSSCCKWSIRTLSIAPPQAKRGRNINPTTIGGGETASTR